MRPPKNFDNKMSRRKQLLPEVPQATADDAGKVVKVGNTGEYELSSDEGLPEVTESDNGKILTVENGDWSPKSIYQYHLFALGNNSIVGLKILLLSINCNTSVYSLSGMVQSSSALRNYAPARGMPITINSDAQYTGFLINFDAKTSVSTMEFKAYVTDGIRSYIAKVVNFELTLTDVSSAQYIDVTASAGVVTLPQDVTYADIVTLVTAGVNVQLRQVLTSSTRYFHLAAYDETSGIYFENSYFAGTELNLNEIHLNETVSEIRHKTITFDT